MADDKKEEIDLNKTSKATLMNFAFFGALVLFLFILIHYAVKRGASA